MSLTGKVSSTSVPLQLLSALPLDKVCVGENQVFRVSVLSNISLYYLSWMQGYDRWGEEEKCKTENEEKCHPVEYK